MTLLQFVLGMTIYNVIWEVLMNIIRSYQLKKEFKRINEQLLQEQIKDDKTWH